MGVISKYSDYIIYAVKCGSLTNAAKALNISQPALSQGISSLEKELGIKILNRRSNPVSLTAEGEIYYRHLLRRNLLESDFLRELDCRRSENDLKVIIGSPAVYVSSVIAPWIEKLSAQGYMITVKTASVEKLCELALSGDIDLFISTTEAPDENLKTEFIFKEEIVLCVPVSAEGKGTVHDLNGKNIIFLDKGMPLQRAVEGYLARLGAKPKCVVTVDQVSEAVSLAEMGVGCCFASKEATLGRNLLTFPTDIEGRSIYLAYDEQLYKTKACKALMNAILHK